MRSSPEQMHTTADRMTARAEEFWTDIDALSKQAAALMASDWIGEAAETHAALWTEWVDSARKVAVALSEDAVLIHQAANALMKTDQANADDLTYIRFNLDDA
ncbi:WXG100 family type VII secretion target [Nocardia suismassiliense]|uniref:WXG100 family type VII secretion target n=1 Tax=Nocardia suismassiliense TaxID=2077092 RepID=A0ABW6QUT8_9NOCA